MNDISYYTDKITSLYKTKPNFMAWLNVLLTPFNDCATLMNEMYQYFDLDSATGVQLDYLGKIIGIKRVIVLSTADIDDIVDIDSVLDIDTLSVSSGQLVDDDYRFLLKATIIMNTWDGTIPSLYERWQTIFPSQAINIYDNQDMTITVTLAGNYTDVQKSLILSGYIVPRPAGVLINYYFGALPTFGWGFDNDMISGFGKGYWFNKEDVE